MNRFLALVAGIALMCIARGSAYAGWTVVSLSPAGAAATGACGLSGNQQVGNAWIGGYSGSPHASLWTGTAGSWVDLHPAESTESRALGVSGGQQVGYVWNGEWLGGSLTTNGGFASLWSGTAESRVDLNPAGARYSRALGISDGQQVGYAGFDYDCYVRHASLWTGTAESWLDLNPTGAWMSVAEGVADGQQVGVVAFEDDEVGSHASLWTGTAESWVDLHPAGTYASWAYGVSGGQQVGTTGIGHNSHASLWSGTAESRVDLNPAGISDSEAVATSDGRQVGYAWAGNHQRASLWSGSAESWLDLHTFLPAGMYSASSASSIDVYGDEIWVAGSAFTTSTRNNHAILWHYTPDPVPEPSSVMALAGGLVSLVGFRRRKSHGRMV